MEGGSVGESYESSLGSLIHYCGLAFGAGYLLVLIGLVAMVVETVARAMPYAGSYGYPMSIPPSLILAVGSLFIAVLFGIRFGVSVIRNSSLRPSDHIIDDVSSSVSSFSLMILLLGIGAIAALSSVPYAPMLTPISLVVGAVLLLVGYRVFLRGLFESKLMGGILMMVSIVLIYIVALSPLRDLYRLFGTASSISTLGSWLPRLPGFLTAELNIETICLIVLAICAVLYAFPSFRSGKGSQLLQMMLSISAIAFGAGLSYFNFSAVSIMSNILSYLGQVVVSIWLVFTGVLVLGISGIIMIVSGSLSLGLSIKKLQPMGQMPPPPPPPPPPLTDQKYERRLVFDCDCILEDELCKALIADEKGRIIGRESCSNDRKNTCCYTCSLHKGCDISCDYLNRPHKSFR